MHSRTKQAPLHTKILHTRRLLSCFIGEIVGKIVQNLPCTLFPRFNWRDSDGCRGTSRVAAFFAAALAFAVSCFALNVGGLTAFATALSGPSSQEERNNDMADLMEQAEKLYSDGQYEKALQLYITACSKASAPVPALLYNVGTCYHKLGELGKAVYYYRKALQCSPIDELEQRIDTNLALAKQTILEQHRDQIEKGGVAHREEHGMWHALFSTISSTFAKSAFIVLWALFFASLSVFTFTSRGILHNISRILFYSLLAPALLAGFFAAGRYYVDTHYHFAIVVSPYAVVREAPLPDSPGKPLLEGMEVLLLSEKKGNYYKIEVGEGRIGYATAGEVWPLKPAGCNSEFCCQTPK